MKFIIEGKLPGLNEIVNQARYNRYAGASQKKKETKRCALEIIRQTNERFFAPVHVSFVWYEKDLRRDPDNIIAGQKFVFDGLVECGRLPDDTRKWVRSIQHRFAPPDKQYPRVEVEVREFEIGGLNDQ